MSLDVANETASLASSQYFFRNKAKILEERLVTSERKLAAISQQLTQREADVTELRRQLDEEQAGFNHVAGRDRSAAAEQQVAIIDTLETEKRTIEHALREADSILARLDMAMFARVAHTEETERELLRALLAGRKLHPNNLSRSALKQRSHMISASGLFDRAAYLTANLDVSATGLDPLRHYLTDGWRDMRDIGLLFDAAWYFRQYRDVLAAGIDPLSHYIEFGAAEGRDPHPLFSTRWYMAKYAAFIAPGENPLAHYMKSGAAKGFWPHPLFDKDFYVATCGEDLTQTPWRYADHYARVGRASGARPSRYFDPVWYFRLNPDVFAAGIDPLVHYLNHGGPEGRSPSPQFDAIGYITHHPEMKAFAGNPLVHFIHGDLVL